MAIHYTMTSSPTVLVPPLDSAINDLTSLYSSRTITPAHILPLLNDGINLVKMHKLSGLEKKQAVLAALNSVILRLPAEDQTLAQLLVKDLGPIAIDTLVMAYKRIPRIHKSCCFGKTTTTLG